MHHYVKRKQIEKNVKEQNLSYLNKHAESIALSKIVIDIEDGGDSSDRKYALTDLFKTYQERVKSLVNRDASGNRTTFKHRLLKLTYLKEEVDKSNKVFLVNKNEKFNKKSLDDIRDDDSLILMKASKLCRQENFLSSEPMFQGTSSEELIKNSPSANLQQLICYILHGESSNNSRDMVIQSICQLLKFNSVKRFRKDKSGHHIRHTLKRRHKFLFSLDYYFTNILIVVILLTFFMILV